MEMKLHDLRLLCLKGELRRNKYAVSFRDDCMLKLQFPYILLSKFQCSGDRDCDSSVGIAIAYGPEGHGIESR